MSGNFDVQFDFRNNIPPPVHYGCVPSYNKKEDDILIQAMIDRLEDQNIVAKARDINITPKYASPAMLILKLSGKKIGKQQYEQLPITEKLKHNRFCLALNKLNDYVQKIPYKYTNISKTIQLIGASKYLITTDLTDSFWQRHIAADKLPYFAFHSPYKGTYIFLRSAQGFLNQSEGLEDLLRCILQEYIALEWCHVHADNLYVLGDTLQDSVDR